MDLDELERLAKAADTKPVETYAEGTRVYGDGHLLVDAYTGLRSMEQCEAFANYIAAASPATILALIERLRAAEAKVSGLAKRLAGYQAEVFEAAIDEPQPDATTAAEWAEGVNLTPDGYPKR